MPGKDGIPVERVAPRPPDDDLAGRVRAAAFAQGAGRVQGGRVLDLFARDGAFGLEALRLGARDVIFVDSSLERVRGIQEKLEASGLAESASIRCADALEEPVLARERGAFAVVLLDPPRALMHEKPLHSQRACRRTR